MVQVVLSPPNAILFVLDPTNKNSSIPLYVDGELTAATASCVSVGTQADVDGDTEISLETTATTPAGLQLVFRGVITTPGRKIAVATSEHERVLDVDVHADSAEISVWVDDRRNPGRVAIGVSGLS